MIVMTAIVAGLLVMITIMLALINRSLVTTASHQIAILQEIAWHTKSIAQPIYRQNEIDFMTAKG